MKKSFFLLILALLVALSGCGIFHTESPAPSETTSQTEETTEYLSPSEETTEEPTEEPTVPEETEPPIVVEIEESWIPILTGLELTAPHYFIYDCDTNIFLTLSGEATETLFPASITKLFAAHVALHYIDPDQTLTAGSELTLIPEDASVAGLEQGDSVYVSQLIEAMLLPSGNDATYVLATAVGRILSEDPTLSPQAAIDRFVEQMNAHAAVLGLTGTHFVTPDGMHDDNHYTCPEDLAKIGLLVLNNPVISSYAAVNSESYVIDETRTLEWKNTNILLDPECEYYCPYAIGLKTGFTTPAGHCFLSAFRVGDRELLIGVFGCEDPYDRFAQTLLLFTQVFDLQIPVLPEEPTDASITTDAAA